MSNIETLIQGIEKAILDKNFSDFEKYVNEIDDMLTEKGEFSNSLLDKLFCVIGSTEFHKMDKSYMLLILFQYNVDILNDQQKKNVVDVLESNFELFKDSTTCFLSAELIAEFFKDKRSLEVLQRLKKVKADIPRALVPHGFAWLAKKCNDRNLVEKIYAELKSMVNDPSKDVRNEVAESMRKLKIA